MPTPRELDARSRALHRVVAQKIREEPARFEEARAILARWRASVSGHTQPYLREWEALLGQGPEAALAVAVEDSERADTLRSCSPLACVLTSRERWAFLEDWSRRRDPRPA